MECGIRNAECETGEMHAEGRRAPAGSYLSCEAKHGQWDTEYGMWNTGNARRRRRRAPVRSYLSCEGKHGQWNTECGTRNTEMHAEGVGGPRVSTLGWVFLNRFCPGGAPGTPFEGASWKHTRSRRNQLWRPFRAPRVKCGNPGLKPWAKSCFPSGKTRRATERQTRHGNHGNLNADEF
jgi:hypothetical protein